MRSVCTVMESRFTLWLNAAENTHFIFKKLELKIAPNSIFYKKLNRRICLSHTRVEVGVSKIIMFEIFEWKNYKSDL